MKTLKPFLFALFFISLLSCNKEETVDYNTITVDKYIELLKAGKYQFSELPAFTSNDIPALLQYRNDTTIITDFPHNMISSLWGPDCKLGVYVLWTIESVRAVAINSKYLIGRFPSQNPILALRSTGELQVDNDETAHKIAAKAYNDWWENNKTKPFDEFKNIDPLGETDYRWH